MDPTDAKHPERSTEGRRLLIECLAPPSRHTQSSIAAALEIGQSSVSLWASGRSRPDTHHRTALRILLSIPEDAWLTPAEKATIARAESAASAASGTEAA